MAKKAAQPRSKSTAHRGLTYSAVQRLALELPEVEEGTSYGTPALKVRGKLLARLWEDGQTLVLKTTLADRDRLLAANPDVLFLTDHYLSHPWILVRLPKISRVFLTELIHEAWRLATEAN